MLRRQWFWAGLLLVAAFAFRQSAAVNLLLIGLALWWVEPRASVIRAGALVTAGALTGFVAGAGLIAIGGSLPGFWRWTIGTLVGYASNSWSPGVVLPRARDSLLPFVVDNAVIWIAAVAMATRWRSTSAGVRLAVVWLAVGMAGSLSGGHLSWHYFTQAMGPLAVLAGVAF